MNISKKEILVQLRDKWVFEENRLLNDIPMATSERITGKSTIFIPQEILDNEDFDKINDRISKSEIVYAIDEKDNFYKIDPKKFDIAFCTNITLIEGNLDWIISNSIVFTGVGVAISFGGTEMIKWVKRTFTYKKRWISKWQ